ncbi:MAG: glycosyltransferase family 4 protein [Nitrospira sp.]|nr:glycosyltransferase family 4 protein [Nitrospira sp.]
MKILVIHSELGVLRGGGENFTRNLFTAFSERGHEVWVTFIADSSGKYPLALPPSFHPLPLAGWWSRKFGQNAISRMASWIPVGTVLRTQWDRVQEALCWRTVRWHDQRFTRRVEAQFRNRWNEFDAVYVHGSVQLAYLIAKLRPTILRLPGPASPDLASILRKISLVCANGDVLVKTREFLGDHAVELPIGLDGQLFRPGTSRIRQQLGWTEQDWVIGYVGRLAYIKGVDLLARAFSKIRRICPQVRLLVIGSGEEQGKLRLCLREELAKGIAWLEADVPHVSLPEWYRAMDLFVMPSRYENYSNAALEALACGVPFLASAIGGNQRLADTEGGWLFSHGSEEALAKSLQAVLSERHAAMERGRVAGEKVREAYSWSCSAGRLEAIFQRIRSSENTAVACMH